MKKLYSVLTIALWSFVGVFVGASLYWCWDYYRRPGLYALTSAPWYLSIQINGILTAAVVLLLLLAMQIVTRKIK